MADPVNGIKPSMQTPDSTMAFKGRGLEGKSYLAFLGEDMIAWLKLNVEGLDNLKRCEEYASKLLREGLILQKVDTNSFTRECYYVFGHGIASEPHYSFPNLFQTTSYRMCHRIAEL